MLAKQYIPAPKAHYGSPILEEYEFPAPEPEAQPTVDVYASMVAEAPLGDIPEPVPADSATVAATATPEPTSTSITTTQAAVQTAVTEEKADAPAFMLLLGGDLLHIVCDVALTDLGVQISSSTTRHSHSRRLRSITGNR